MKRIIFFILSLGVLCYACNSSKPEKGELKVMFSWTPGPENAFLFYGMDQGVFDSLGLKLEWFPSKGSSVVATALANNEINFGFISSDYVLVSKWKEFPIKALLTLYHETPVVIYSLKKNNITTINDLKGKNIGMLSKSAAGAQAISFLREHGLNENIDYKSVFSKGSVQEILNGNVDAMVQYVNYGPPEIEAKHGEKVNVIKLKDYGINIYGSSIAVNENFYKSNPEIVEKFVFGLLKSLEISRGKHAEVLESLLKHDINLDRAEMDMALHITEKMIYDDKVDSLGVGYMTYDGWMETLKYLNGVSGAKINEKTVGQTFDTSLLKKYNEQKK